MSKKKVLVAMSGGVDSSVAAGLLKQQGYEIAGVTLKLFHQEDQEDTRTCCSLADVEDARYVCMELGIDHFVFNFGDKFGEEVISRFVRGYQEGRTPNPCIDCNKYIKFDALLQRAEVLGFDYIATGHYARIEKDNSTRRYLLKRPFDAAKDQTYVLYGMTQHQLSKTLFPLGDLDKATVRKIASEMSMINANKPDSQEICFVPNNDHGAFIRYHTGQDLTKGFFVNIKGEVLGEHKGIEKYTVGQRKGLGVSFGKPMYVVAKDYKTKNVVLGNLDDLMSNTLIAEEMNWVSIESLNEPMRLTAKIRYSHQDKPATVYTEQEGKVRVVFEEPIKAITPGQAVVFYDGDYLVGGGIITG